jgi:hypothetical protein
VARGRRIEEEDEEEGRRTKKGKKEQIAAGTKKGRTYETTGRISGV